MPIYKFWPKWNILQNNNLIFREETVIYDNKKTNQTS